MDFCMTTRDAILWNIKCLRFESHNHAIGPIDSIMEVLHTTIKGKLMDTLERFYIYKVTHENIQINDKNTSKPNAIFDTIIREEAIRQLTNQ